MLHIVIMAGGGGTRFWPLGRRERPKQFLPLLSEQTLLQQTAARCDGLISPEQLWVVTNAGYAAEVQCELPQLPRPHLLLEPCGRNTAPCLGLAALLMLREDPEAVMLAVPSDHAVATDAQFAACVQTAVATVEQNPQAVVLLGVTPTEPATGFGYIERGDPLTDGGPFQVSAFHEKPTRAVAETFVASGRHLWNCGIFVWRADRVVALIEQHLPELAQGLHKIAEASGTSGAEAVLQAEFPKLPAVSIDRGVIELADEVYAVEATFRWADVGTWPSLSRHLGADANGNTVIGLHVGLETQDCVIRTEGGHLVATVGLSDCVIVHTPDATLVARKGDEEGLRRLVAELEARGYGRLI